jgi:hypothetical protein
MRLSGGKKPVIITRLRQQTGKVKMLVKYVLSDGISQAFLPFRVVDVIVITNHHLFMNIQNDVIGLVL